LYAHQPIHQASDSNAYVRKANAILDGSFYRRRKKRPWGTQKDGDLWQVFYEVAKAKGHDSIRISWTKAHANSEHVAAGITTEYNKTHNQKADAIADEGIKGGYNPGLYELASHFAAQRQETGRVIVRIQKAILRVLKAENAERIDKEEKFAKEQRCLHGKDAGKVTLPRELPWAISDEEEGSCRIAVTNPHIGDIDPAACQATFMIVAFIRNSRWLPTQGAKNGTSWIELFATFYIAGGRTLKNDFECPSYYEIGKFKDAYMEFRRLFHQIIQMWIAPEYRFMFEPARVGKARLSEYGIFFSYTMYQSGESGK
jgi:hypothetical protein